jgi:hypothetical protein
VSLPSKSFFRDKKTLLSMETYETGGEWNYIKMDDFHGANPTALSSNASVVLK